MEVCRPEQLQLKEITTRPDTVYRCKNNISIVLEFQSTNPSKKRLREMLRYVVNEIIEQDNLVKVVIISSVAKKTDIVKVPMGPDTYFPFLMVSLKSIDGEKEIFKIKEKIKNNEILDEDDELKLALMPFTSLQRPVETVIYDAVKLTNEAKMNQRGRNFLKEIQSLLTEKFVPKNKQRLIKREIKMYNELFKEEFEEARNEGKEIGMEKGIEEGKEKGIEEVARNMLEKDFSFEQISEVTGLSKKQIEEL